MKKRIKIDLILSIALFTLSALLGSCEKDVFSPERVKATYEDKFPVKDIDPDMDWKMTRQVTIDISVYEDYGVDYTVEVFDRNPYSTDTIPHLLARGTANQELSFRTTIDCPSALSTLYVSRTDEAGRRIFKPVAIANDKLTTSFGSRTSTRSFSPSTKSEDDFNISAMSRPYTDNEIANMLSKAIEYTGQDMDADIANQNIFKITDTYRGGINHGGTPTPSVSTLKLIIAPGGKWKVTSPQTVNQGLEIIVASDGKIELSSGSNNTPALKFTNTASLAVLGTAYQEDEEEKDDEDDDVEDTRGRISGNGWIEFSNGGTNYNAGHIDIDGINNNGGTFFNYGKIDVKKLYGSSTGSLFVNHGDFEAGQIGDDNQSVGPLLENTCKIEVDNDLTSYGITLGRGAYIECQHLHASGHINMSDNSMIEVENNSWFNNCNITGPTAPNSYALLKLKNIQYANWTGSWQSEVTQGYVINNIYCEYKGGGQNATWNFEYCCLNGTAGGNGRKGNGNAVACKPGEAPKYIPGGRCTGEGNTPGEGDPGEEPQLMPYTYVFEDNYPLVGDYDFNDVVLDVTINYDRGRDNKITTTRIDVKLVAAGAGKTVGAGLRLVGIDNSVVSNISFEGADQSRFQSTLSGSMFSTDMESDGTIPLLGSVHKVFGVTAGTLVNTGGETAPIYTYQIKIEQNNAYQREAPVITKDNLDFFITYGYKTMQKRMEVHLYEFWKYGATAAGTVQQENLDLAGNNTWAICVPNFRYPKERINISNQKDEKDCAYPKFLDWARNRNVNQDWYKYPNEENVYR
ncbi:LruC domain-containing protein [Bacteroides timonensis]|uniref:LruC domain-containing protein n=1 Tax=Bacteroides timonensis TaxID=1470345 RepID=UPI0004B8CDAD|nr:LruC domain-containing protein [Bacteroides timonensis]